MIALARIGAVRGARLKHNDLSVIQPTLTVGQWVTGFATTNILFHLSMAYATLRSRGVPLAKQDLFTGGL